MALLYYAHMNKMTFALLQTSARENSPVAGAEVELRSCSSCSMYSLVATVGTAYVDTFLSAEMLKAWDRCYYGGCIQRHPVKALGFQHCAGAIYLIFREVGICQLSSPAFLTLESLVTPQLWTWKSSSSTKPSPGRTPSCWRTTSEDWDLGERRSPPRR